MYRTAWLVPGGNSRGEAMDSLISGIAAPPGIHSRTVQRKPAAETFSSTVYPGLRRFEMTSQPHTLKFGYTSAWLKVAGLGSGVAKACRWNSSVRAMAEAFCAESKSSVSCWEPAEFQIALRTPW